MNQIVAEPEAGSKPLKSQKYEIYAQQRALCSPPETAAQYAGYPPRCGAHTRLEKRQDVRDRIKFLCGDDVAILREKRRRIEERLNLTAYANIFDFVDIDQETKQPKPIDIAELAKDERLGQLVTEFLYDQETNRLRGFRFSRGDALAAIAQLRDMYGLKSVTKIAPTNPEGDGPPLAPEITDEDRIRALLALWARQKTEAA